MPASVHKLLIHGEEIISNFTIPIGKLSEEASEVPNKEFRKYREIHSRKINRIATNEDILLLNNCRLCYFESSIKIAMQILRCKK